MRCATADAGRSQLPARDVPLARHVVNKLGGRYSAELGIDVDARDAAVEQWSA
jgi:hypothetical protein